MPRRPRTAVLLAVIAMLPTGCLFGRSRSLPPLPLRSTARDSLLAADIARGPAASMHGLSAAVATWLDTNAVYLRAGAPIIYGRTAALPIAAAGVLDSATYRWQPLGGGLARDGRTGYTYGIAATIGAGNATDAPRVRLDRYLAYWRRGADGIWRIAAYCEVQGTAVPAESQPAASELPPPMTLSRGARATAARQAREADSAFALAADLQGSGVAFSKYIAPFGAVFAGPELVTGPAAVKELFEEQQRAGGTLNWRPVYADAADSGDLGITVGESVFTGRGATGAVVQRFGKYLTVWRRQPNGDWRFVIDGGNASPTPAR